MSQLLYSCLEIVLDKKPQNRIKAGDPAVLRHKRRNCDVIALCLPVVVVKTVG